MPLPVLPADNTARFKLSYVNDGFTHTLTARSTPISPATAGTHFDALFTALSPMLPITSILDVQFAAAGSNVFNPVTTGIEGNIYGSGSGAPIGASENVGFVGRTSGGRRARLWVYGINAIASADFRFNPGESADVDNAIIAIRAATGLYLGIDGLAPTWKGYANAGVNAFWQRKLRP